MSAAVQGRTAAEGGGEAEKRGQEEEGGRGPPELQRGRGGLRRRHRLRPRGDDCRGSHRKDLLVKQQRNSVRMKKIERKERQCVRV